MKNKKFMTKPRFVTNETIDVMEPVLFTDLNVLLVKRSTLSSMRQPLLFISKQWDLNLKKSRDFKIASRIITRSIICN